MKTSTTRLAAGLALAFALAACSGSAPGPVSTPAAPSAAPPITTLPIGNGDPTPVPAGGGANGGGANGGAPSSPGTDPGGLVPGDGGSAGSGSGSGSGGSGSGGSSSGGSAPGDPGTGVVTSPPNNGGGGGGQVPDPQATIVNPVAGLQGIHAVNATKLEPGVNGANLSVRVSWWSGVEPCSVLAGVTVARDGNTFKLTVTEGSKGQNVACVEMAMYKATIVNLGKVDPGTYTITATGDAPAVKVEVKG